VGRCKGKNDIKKFNLMVDRLVAAFDLSAALEYMVRSMGCFYCCCCGRQKVDAD